MNTYSPLKSSIFFLQEWTKVIVKYFNKSTYQTEIRKSN
jgi:hypothetical protein